MRVLKQGLSLRFGCQGEVEVNIAYRLAQRLSQPDQSVCLVTNWAASSVEQLAYVGLSAGHLKQQYLFQARPEL